ncbi:tRNA-splicing endonuclease-like protein subunit sen34 [Paraphoma chrysanthemicola]|uniref:tRNA-splicing endonuclease subunit Sen34 n=1 Tax=Paraphoma chrysanthemicola TaxID=798071 RepID=A0A8K0R8F4_9PLEO|nr:tRNA-splicing endonuclease-like protein subunit sen34 [Paraphoma chrysanthemicola]
MAPSVAPNTVNEPFPISRVANRYLLFSIDIISHCRRNHNICGMLVGTIPNLSQQNVFLGIPLELMPEEARVLVEKGAAYIVDDEAVHQRAFGEMSREERLRWLEEMDKRGEEVTKGTEDLKEMRKERALKEKGLRREVLEKKDTSATETSSSYVTLPAPADHGSSSSLGFIMKGSSFTELASSDTSRTETTKAETLFDSRPASPAPSTVSTTSKPSQTPKHFVTPTTSYPPMENPTPDSAAELPAVPKSYPLFRYLHSLGYYHMPGLRFGCHYNSYPGDPLRYHSHFAATGFGWDDEFDLLDVVGGGRLATGTKKAYMIGGEDVDVARKKSTQSGGAGLFSDASKDDDRREVRAFSIEWAAL